MKLFLAILGLVFVSNAAAQCTTSTNGFFNYINQLMTNSTLVFTVPSWIEFDYKGQTINATLPNSNFDWGSTVCNWISSNTGKSIWTVNIPTTTSNNVVLTIPAFVSANANFSVWNWTAPSWVSIKYGSQGFNVSLSTSYNWTALGNAMGAELFTQTIWNASIADATKTANFNINVPAFFWQGSQIKQQACANNAFYQYINNEMASCNWIFSVPSYIDFSYKNQNINATLPTSSFNWGDVTCAWVLNNTGKSVWTIEIPTTNGSPVTLSVPEFVSSNANFTQWTWTAPSWISVQSGSQAFNVSLSPSFNWTALGNSMEAQINSQTKSVYTALISDSTNSANLAITIPAFITKSGVTQSACANNGLYNFIQNEMMNSNWTLTAPSWLGFSYAGQSINVSLPTSASFDWNDYLCEWVLNNTGKSIWTVQVPTTVGGSPLTIMIPAFVSSNANFTQWTWKAPEMILIANGNTSLYVELDPKFDWTALGNSMKAQIVAKSPQYTAVINDITGSAGKNKLVISIPAFITVK